MVAVDAEKDSASLPRVSLIAGASPAVGPRDGDLHGPPLPPPQGQAQGPRRTRPPAPAGNAGRPASRRPPRPRPVRALPEAKRTRASPSRPRPRRPRPFPPMAKELTPARPANRVERRARRVPENRESGAGAPYETVKLSLRNGLRIRARWSAPPEGRGRAQSPRGGAGTMPPPKRGSAGRFDPWEPIDGPLRDRTPSSPRLA